MKRTEQVIIGVILLLVIAPVIYSWYVARRSAATTHHSAAHPPSPALVWVNTKSGIYHRFGSEWYGRTHHGGYMTEAEAKADGYILAANGQ